MSADSDRSRASNSIIDGLERLAEALRSVTEEAREFEHSVSLGGTDEGVEGVMRVELRTGIGEAEATHTTTTTSTGRAEADSAAEGPSVRRPSVEVDMEEAHVRVVAEMPGVTTEALDWAVTDRALSLTATTPRARYERVVTLPAPVDPEAATVTVEAGIVELAWPRPTDADE